MQDSLSCIGVPASEELAFCSISVLMGAFLSVHLQHIKFKAMYSLGLGGAQRFFFSSVGKKSLSDEFIV